MLLFFSSFPPPAPPHRRSSFAYPTDRAAGKQGLLVPINPHGSRRGIHKQAECCKHTHRHTHCCVLENNMEMFVLPPRPTLSPGAPAVCFALIALPLAAAC